MWREATIIIVILVLLFVGNYLTQSNTTKSVEIMTQELQSLKEDMMEHQNKQQIEKKMEESMDKWHKIDETMAYYIEHDELEKVETGLTGLKASLAVEDYEAGVVELEKAIYLLEHIKEKQVFSFINIF